MSTFKKLALSLLLAMPMVASAAGMGIYVPLSVGDSISTTNDWDGYTRDLEFDPGVGFGLTFDSNIGKDKLLNYRLGLEYSSASVNSVNGNAYAGDTEYLRYNMVHTFGFGVLRTKMIRLWVGPRINIAYNVYDNPAVNSFYTESNIELGIAPAVGVNLNLGRLVSLGFDVDYRFAYLAGTWESTLNDDTYTGSASGPTARFYVLFRFGEEFQAQAPQPANQGVIDQSL